ncbi:hypothetical protein SCOR_14615 [Sulfidibacter corallicola]|uniref:DNRLRE domain-containing protein n=1 Tax=Sulfidibacter corallicola TaxID=2818388 RepID=A0A8A4TXU3_SULCO|nr:hypothetical protein [Sulfidibacter corallicola]QTD54303.1 hypothetical protein J3U87_17805 [Sulfidibacter corallicola]
MNFKKLLLVALMAAGSMAFGAIELRTTVNPVYVRGTCEQAGIIFFSVTGDDFARASTSAPVYIRLTLDHNAKLCKTLVWSHSSNINSHTFNPIYLPLYLEAGQGAVTDTVAAPDATLSVVRWKAGEASIWLKVQSSSSDWIDTGGGTESPTPNQRISFVIGVPASESWERHSDMFTDGRANLPFATRDLDAGSNDFLDAVSTLICTDLSNSNLEPLPAPQDVSGLNFDPNSYDETTENVEDGQTEGSIQEGTPVSVAFSNDLFVARGFDFNCDGAPQAKPPFVRANLCLITGQNQGEEDQGLVCVPNTVVVNVACGQGRGFHIGSFIELRTPNDRNYGFRFYTRSSDGFFIDEDLNAVNPAGILPQWLRLDSAALSVIPVAPDTGSFDLPFGDTTNSFSAGGTLLTRRGQIVFDGPGVPDDITLSVSATVCSWYEEDPSTIDITVDFWATNLDSVIDSDTRFPGIDNFGLDQEVACDPSARLAFTYDWAFGEFLPCESSACTRIFFQYVPRAIKPDGSPTGFFAGVSFVNHGQADLDSVTGIVYEADGTEWQVEFPELAVRNQQTWLLWFDEESQTVVFADSDDTSISQAPVLQDDTVLREFGTQRSSMFVVGCATADDLSLNTLVADLDGYLLIGKDGVISGAYGARNTEDHPQEQSGDLPVLSQKRAIDTGMPAEKRVSSFGTRDPFMIK